MKRILIAVVCIFIGLQVVVGQIVYCNLHSDTCPDDFPPNADIIIGGDYTTIYGTDILESDADWYFYDGATRTWSTLVHSQIQPFASSVFDEEFDHLGWEEYLKDNDTFIQITEDGNVIYVFDETRLHLIDFLANVVLSIPYSYSSSVSSSSCRTLNGKRIDRQYLLDSRPNGKRIIRCYHQFDFTNPDVEIRAMKDHKNIKLSVLKVLNLINPFEYEKIHARIEHHLNPPEIWFYDIYEYGLMPEIYIKFDSTYIDGLGEDGLGPQRFGSISLHPRLVQYDSETVKYLDLSEGKEGKRRARSQVLHTLEHVLSSTGKWLLIMKSEEHTLIRNLSNIYLKKETNQNDNKLDRRH